MEIYKPKYIDEYTIRYDSMDEFYAIACTRLSEWENWEQKSGIRNSYPMM